jgi:hypothetical protein
MSHRYRIAGAWVSGAMALTMFVAARAPFRCL